VDLDIENMSRTQYIQARSYVEACENVVFPPLASTRKCDVCENRWDKTPTVPCGGCDIAVHVGCFGEVTRDKIGRWLCFRCENINEEIRCELCPRKDGVIKLLKSTDGYPLFVHSRCAIFCPDLHFHNTPTLEPVQGFAKITPTRPKSTCCICRRKGAGNGFLVQCREARCTTLLHINCGWEMGLLSGKESKDPRIKFSAICMKHAQEDRDALRSMVTVCPRWKEICDGNVDVTAASSFLEQEDDKASEASEGGGKYCVCQAEQTPGEVLIECSANIGGCNGWVHPVCIGMSLDQADDDDVVVTCPLCKAKLEEMGTSKAGRNNTSAVKKGSQSQGRNMDTGDDGDEQDNEEGEEYDNEGEGPARGNGIPHGELDTEDIMDFDNDHLAEEMEGMEGGFYDEVI
jgi:hypothetical protein